MSDQCAFCGRRGKLKTKHPPSCGKCYDRHMRPRKRCDGCGYERIIKKRQEKTSLCGTCWKKQSGYSPPQGVCQSCGKRDVIVRGLCRRCYSEQYVPKQCACGLCGKSGTIHKICNDGRPVCRICYIKHFYKQPTEPCCLCMRPRGVHCRGKHGGSLCQRCVQTIRDMGFCSECGRQAVLIRGKCSSCRMKGYKRTLIFCMSCRHIKYAHKRIPKTGWHMCESCYKRDKYHTDPSFRTKVLLRSRLRKALENKSLRKKDLKGFTIDYRAIIKHLGSMPTDGQTYHIDHIVPLCAFNLLDPIQTAAAFHPKNHQWMTAKDNLTKGDRYSFQSKLDLLEMVSQ